MSEFSVLESVTREVTFRGGPLKISPLKIGQIPAFTRAIRPCFAALAGFIASVPSGDAAGGGGEPATDLKIDLEKIGELVADHGDALIQAAAIAVRKDKAFIEDMTADEFISLVRVIVEVNVDFFGQAVSKAVAENRKGNGVGETPSSS